MDQDYCFVNAQVADHDVISNLEAISFPADEAATPEKILYRIENASDFFYVLRKKDDDKRIIGFINGTCVAEMTIHHDSMSHHDPLGRTLVIHSVTVDPAFRRQGLATKMLKNYIQEIATKRLVTRILLLTKENNILLYLNVGFQYIRVSPVVHGQEKWLELGLNVQEFYGIEQWHVDAFTNQPFAGNPAAVVLVQKTPEWMQKVAMENNYAETSFLTQLAINRYHLRWFTPSTEVELCGHATLAAAHALYESGHVAPLQPITFETLYSGELVATQTAEGALELSFPSTGPAPVLLSTEELHLLCKAFDLLEQGGVSSIMYTGRSLYDLVVEVTPQAFLRTLSATIQFDLLTQFGGRGVVLTSQATSLSSDLIIPERLQGYDFWSRGFFPRYGINEDPVTGSAHCALAPYWMAKLAPSSIATESRSVTLKGYQASKRGGAVAVTLQGDRVVLTGKCVTTLKSKILA